MNKTLHDSETPAHGKQVISVVGFIHKQVDDKTTVLLAKRAMTKKFLPGKFEMPGGHVDFGEDIIDGLKRELDEELGVKVSVGDAFYSSTYENKIKGSHTVEVVYFCTLTSPEGEIEIHPEDHSEINWYNRDELMEIHSEVDASSHPESLDLDGKEDPEWLALMKGFDILESNNWNRGDK